MKQVLPLHNWEYEDASSSQDRQALLERAAEERHQKLQTLKQVEFEREMLVERDERIRQIESDVIDVNQIMKELSAMVQEQGENLSKLLEASRLVPMILRRVFFRFHREQYRPNLHTCGGRTSTAGEGIFLSGLNERIFSVDIFLKSFFFSQRTHCKWLCFLAILGVTMAGVVALILYIELRPS